jgi:alcohol dehydrogenase class IV
MKEHRINFAGTIAFADTVADVPLDGAVGLVSAGPAAGLDHGGARVLDARPDRGIVDELAAAVRVARPAVVYGAGSGAVLDAAKLAAHHAGHQGEIVLVPAGDEPWRAFAPFSVVDHAGERPTLGDATGGLARVIIVAELLAAIDAQTVAVSALDTAVHAIEVQLSTRSQPYARALAATALRIIAERFDAALTGGRDARVELVLAAQLAVEAFMGTNLGIAHALASPLGTHLGITHDTINAVLGRWAVTFRPDSDRLAGLAAALGAPEPLAAYDDLRERAGLPRTLRGLGISWDAVEAALPTAVNSSGIRGAVSLDELRDFARAAWDEEE